jgi:hypothetical protein
VKTAAELREEAMAELRRMSAEDMKAASRGPRRRPPLLDGSHSRPHPTLQQILAATTGGRPPALAVCHWTDARRRRAPKDKYLHVATAVYTKPLRYLRSLSKMGATTRVRYTQRTAHGFGWLSSAQALNRYSTGSYIFTELVRLLRERQPVKRRAPHSQKSACTPADHSASRRKRRIVEFTFGSEPVQSPRRRIQRTPASFGWRKRIRRCMSACRHCAASPTRCGQSQH